MHLLEAARMYAQCPECLTVFSLDAEALAQGRGTVTCGYCSGTFDALTNLTGQLPPEPFERLPLRSLTGPVPRLELAVYRPPLDDAPTVVEPGEPVGTDAPDTPAEQSVNTFSPLTFSPRFARGQRPHRSTPTATLAVHDRRWPWVFVCALLLLLLGVQLAWAKREALISDQRVGGWLRDTCATLGCRLPLVQDVRQLQLMARDVRTRPDSRGTLAISATVRNDAAFAQPYPVVTLTLSDAHGKPVAMRRLRPGEYLADRTALRAGLPPGSSIALLFEVQDPGDAAGMFGLAFE